MNLFKEKQRHAINEGSVTRCSSAVKERETRLCATYVVAILNDSAADDEQTGEEWEDKVSEEVGCQHKRLRHKPPVTPQLKQQPRCNMHFLWVRL